MNPYKACVSCACYIKRNEAVCPFCGAANRAEPGGPRGTATRMARSQWLACSATIAVVGCSGDGTTESRDRIDAAVPVRAHTPLVESGSVWPSQPLDSGIPVIYPATDGASPTETHDMVYPGGNGGIPISTAVDAASDAGTLSADAQGTFPCAGGHAWDPPEMMCDRETQWCFINNGGYPSPSGCEPLSSTCVGDSGAEAGCNSLFRWTPQNCHGRLRRCACVTVTCGTFGICTDDDAGGITVSCGECYGSPPARLERLWRKRLIG
jgi:hypothetical protein